MIRRLLQWLGLRRPDSAPPRRVEPIPVVEAVDHRARVLRCVPIAGGWQITARTVVGNHKVYRFSDARLVPGSVFDLRDL